MYITQRFHIVAGLKNDVHEEVNFLSGSDCIHKGASNKYVRLDGGRGGQPKAYSVNKAM